MFGSKLTPSLIFTGSMSSSLFVLLLSLLLGLQPVATDLYLPALPAITTALDGTVAQGQMTLSVLLLTFGVSQLVWGPISDRFGRRPILLIGVAGYTVAAVGAMLATTMELLVFWRGVQGLAMGSVVVCARAVVRDLYPGALGARAMSKGLSGLGIIACVSGPLGSLAAALLGWRASLGVLTLFALVTLLIVALRLKETLHEKDPHALRPVALARNWIHILGNRTFWAFSLLATGSYGCLFTFLAASSFVLIDVLGVSPTVYGLLLATMSLSYISGTLICRRLLLHLGVRRTVFVGGALSFAGGTIMGTLALAGVSHAAAIMLPLYLVISGHGIHQSCGQSGAVSPFPRSAGVAAALSGSMMTVMAFSTSLWLGPRMDGTVLPLTNGIWFWATFTAFIAWFMVQRLTASPHDD